MDWWKPWRRSAPPAATAREAKAAGGFVAMQALGDARWSRRDYAGLAREGYMGNPVVFRCVRLLAEAAASVPLLVYEDGGETVEHPLLELIARPNPRLAGKTFLEALYGHLLIAGNAYVELVDAGEGARELHLCRSSPATAWWSRPAATRGSRPAGGNSRTASTSGVSRICRATTGPTAMSAARADRSTAGRWWNERGRDGRRGAGGGAALGRHAVSPPGAQARRRLRLPGAGHRRMVRGLRQRTRGAGALCARLGRGGRRRCPCRCGAAALPGENPDGAVGPNDVAALRAAIAGGERFDWFYASDADRAARLRTPITDGAYGKDWVFRAKDMAGWWSSPHHDRHGGIEDPAPTAWVPRSKPIWFTELGCPAVDKGANQPNVFLDPKSAESFLPHHSSGARDDGAQRAFLDAHLGHWDPDAAGFSADRNPLSELYGGRMVDPARIYLWAWDARPYPAFPARQDRWSDGPNWAAGHWLTGRLGGAPVAETIDAILADQRLPAADTMPAGGTLDGYVVADPGTARAALEPMIDLFGLSVNEADERLRFATRGASATGPATVDRLVLTSEGAFEQVRQADHELPSEVQLAWRDPMRDYRSATVRAFRAGSADANVHALSLPAALDSGSAEILADAWLRRRWDARETVRFALPGPDGGVEPGRLVRLPAIDADAEYEVVETADGLVRAVTAMRIMRAAPAAVAARVDAVRLAQATVTGPPAAIFLDLPISNAATPIQDGLRLAAWCKPWRTQLAFASPGIDGFGRRGSADAPATIGRLSAPLTARFEGRIDRIGEIFVALDDGELSSIGRLHLLNGGNRAAIRAANSAWEIVQFEQAEESAPGLWRLGRLLRGQLGTGDAMQAGATAGADFVLLDDAVVAAGLAAGETGLTLNWRVGPAGADFTPAFFETQAVTGGVRAGLPLAPCHLRMRPEGGDLRFGWVRRGRVDADDWAPADIPLGEATERYRIEIGPVGGTALRAATVTEPAFLYTASALAADFGTSPPALEVAVCQIGDAATGLPATKVFSIP